MDSSDVLSRIATELNRTASPRDSSQNVQF
jgi:hypothetical protein